MTNKDVLRSVISIALLAAAAASAQTQAYRFASIDYPNAIRNRAFGISPGGVIVGYYRDSSAILHGFLLVGGQYVTVDVPGAVIGLTGVLPTAPRGMGQSWGRIRT
jgi:hypothetical protein